MKHFAILDDETFSFLLKLRTVNPFWFGWLVQCAKKNPRLADRCIDEAVSTLNYSSFKIDEVNTFQICKAANCGLLDIGLFDLSLKLPSWSKYLTIKTGQMLSEYKPRG